MVMGPVHAMSGAAVWLAGAVVAQSQGFDVDVPVALVGAAVCSGAALLPDIDHPGSLSTRDGSTVVRAFGFVGEAFGHLTAKASVGIYSLTRARRDEARTGGHRTFTHTVVFALLAGSLLTGAGLAPGTVNLGSYTWGTGQFIALVTMWAMLHLALFGLFEKWTKAQRRKRGLLAVMAFSGALTSATAVMVPPAPQGYPWLGAAIAAGCVLHCLGDAITKAGAPMLWPLTIRGKRWYDVALPSLLRIKADGMVANVLLGGALTGVAVLSLTRLLGSHPLA